MIRIPKNIFLVQKKYNYLKGEFLHRFDNVANLAIDIALSYLHTPYRWGGDDPIDGVDCSGMIVEIMQSVGMIKHGSDYTAHGLMNLFSDGGLTLPPSGHNFAETGALAFYGTEEKITHVGMIIGDGFVISASGGGSSTKTIQDAASQNAFVKIRPINYRSDLVKIVDPFFIRPKFGLK